jgi:hypothetical protein
MGITILNMINLKSNKYTIICYRRVTGPIYANDNIDLIEKS